MENYATETWIDICVRWIDPKKTAYGHIVHSEDESEEETAEEITDENASEESNAGEDEDIESIIKLKEETDNWLIDQLKSKGNNGGDDSLRAEVAELKDRVEKLEKIIKNLTKAFE